MPMYGCDPAEIRKKMEKLNIAEGVENALNDLKNNHTIHLVVNTSRIRPNPNQDPKAIGASEVDQWCEFFYAHGSLRLNLPLTKASGSNEDFDIKVKALDNIFWNGGAVSDLSNLSNNGDSVQISEIDYENGRNLFGDNIDLKEVGNSGVVQGKVRRDVNNADQMNYKIVFKVYKGGYSADKRPYGTYEIDPKISIKPQQ